VCLLLVYGTALAAPKQLGNCKTITEPGSYILKKSLTASGDCFVITTSLVTLDLDGQTITGDGTGAAVTTGGVSRRAITVRNGNISNFNVGVNLAPSANITVRDLNIWNTAGDGLRVGSSSVVTGNAITNSGGIGIFVNSSSVVTNNVIDSAGTDGVLEAGGQSLISNNTIHAGGGIGVNGAPGTGTVVSNNTILGFVGGAVRGTQLQIMGNNLSGGTATVNVTCPSNVTDNTIVWLQPGGTAIVTSGVGCNVTNNATN